MSYARNRLESDVVIVRRVVTRDADGGSEDHDSMTLDQFVIDGILQSGIVKT